MALSMLGYRCCSDLEDLPEDEKNKLLLKEESPIFDAYVNVGFVEESLGKLAKLYPTARLILVFDNNSNTNFQNNIQEWSERVLVLQSSEQRKWKLLCEFLGIVPPASP